MKQIAGYIADYFRHLNKLLLVTISLIVSSLIFVNYTYHLNDILLSHTFVLVRTGRFYCLFGLVFAISWLARFVLDGKPFPVIREFYLLILVAPFIFALKVSIQADTFFTLDSAYLNTVLVWPVKAVVTFCAVWLVWWITGNQPPVAGMSTRNFRPAAYFLLLMLMIPLLLIAGRGADFQQVYPKLQMIREPLTFWQKIFFEICYGLDFFTIELFFRGFLILAFIKYSGRGAILPMAAFYCTIHFGKPLAECISSYFGGLILGAVVYNTRSIWGGLIMHLGIAWMMEMVGIWYT